MKILVINPGGGSTKIGIWHNKKKIFDQTITHSPKELAKFSQILKQEKFRYNLILDILNKNNFNLADFAGIATRGGPLKRLTAGTYRITDRVISDIRKGKVQSQHPSLLGPLIAKTLGDKFHIPAYFVDQESVDEFEPIARISGLPQIERKALAHTTSVKMAVRQATRKLKKAIGQGNF